MKKIFLVLIMCIMGFSLSACGQSVKNDILNHFSDIRYNVFMGKNDNLTATVMCGLREVNYAYDGISNKSCEFGIITINLLNKNDCENIPYKLQVGEVEYNGFLEENPYDHSFMVDIEKIIDNEEIVYLTIENLCENLMLICESKDFVVQYGEAIEIGIDNLSEEIESFYTNKKFCAECYLKIIFDNTSQTSPFYWYFGIVGQNGNDVSVIIDPQTSAIITKSV